ncbi:hypothetical protein AOX59_15735 [Lentibacillus amyloliquefaciens]|uniref:Uncharacterized protein n=1 Tax=Lentibacillus amyloliquefaciens TaxID=1472767 RepID=A0A0U4DX16_9BACI|nr:hypothetical protein AOX59_15735 [Lentibacillus amyloliquefaciens]
MLQGICQIEQPLIALSVISTRIIISREISTGNYVVFMNSPVHFILQKLLWLVTLITLKAKTSHFMDLMANQHSVAINQRIFS